jgi:hypothetical protein
MFSFMSSAKSDLRTAASPCEEDDLLPKAKSLELERLHAYPHELSMTTNRLTHVMKLSLVHHFLALNH